MEDQNKDSKTRRRKPGGILDHVSSSQGVLNVPNQELTQSLMGSIDIGRAAMSSLASIGSENLSNILKEQGSYLSDALSKSLNSLGTAQAISGELFNKPIRNAQEIISGLATSANISAATQVLDLTKTLPDFKGLEITSLPEPIQQLDHLTKEKLSDLSEKLNSSLGEIRKELADRHRGVWGAMRSDNPDKVRQAAHSMRELVRDVLEILAPDEEVESSPIFEELKPPDYERVTYRMRLRYAISKSKKVMDFFDGSGLEDSMEDERTLANKLAHTGGDLELTRSLIHRMEAGLNMIILASRI